MKKGEQVIIFNTAGNMYNETQYAAKPLIRVYGSGAGTVGIGSETITISAISQYVDIDCEIMDAFKGAINCNANVSFSDDMIVIPSGSCGVNFTGNISRVEITPRWWII